VSLYIRRNDIMYSLQHIKWFPGSISSEDSEGRLREKKEENEV